MSTILTHKFGLYAVIFCAFSVSLPAFGAGLTNAGTLNGLDTPPMEFSANADDLAADINRLLKKELEKEFGPLDDKIQGDEQEMWGRVIAIDFALTEGRKLDDSWGAKVVAALVRLGIEAVNEGDEVRADDQAIAGKTAGSMQFTTARNEDEPDIIGFTAMFPG